MAHGAVLVKQLYPPRIHRTGVQKDLLEEGGMAAYASRLHAGWVRTQMVDWKRRYGTSLEIDVLMLKLMSKPINQPETMIINWRGLRY